MIRMVLKIVLLIFVACVAFTSGKITVYDYFPCS